MAEPRFDERSKRLQSAIEHAGVSGRVAIGALTDSRLATMRSNCSRRCHSGDGRGSPRPPT